MGMARTTAQHDEKGRPVYVSEGAVRQQGSKKLYECNTCHRDVVWLESKRSGKVYLASVYAGQVSRYYVSQPHKCAGEGEGLGQWRNAQVGADY